LLKRKSAQKIFDNLSNITVLPFEIKTCNIKTSDELRTIKNKNGIKRAARHEMTIKGQMYCC